MHAMSTVAHPAKPCVICGKPQDARLAPFCSKRCADIDLHRWLSGVYAIPDSVGPSLYNPPRSPHGLASRAGAQVAQLVEHVTENHGVGGSIPPLGTKHKRNASVSDLLFHGVLICSDGVSLALSNRC